jgi:hypothetical protein
MEYSSNGLQYCIDKPRMERIVANLLLKTSNWVQTAGIEGMTIIMNECMAVYLLEWVMSVAVTASPTDFGKH